jgi:hypothetical protein
MPKLSDLAEITPSPKCVFCLAANASNVPELTHVLHGLGPIGLQPNHPSINVLGASTAREEKKEYCSTGALPCYQRTRLSSTTHTRVIYAASAKVGYCAAAARCCAVLCQGLAPLLLLVQAPVLPSATPLPLEGPCYCDPIAEHCCVPLLLTQAPWLGIKHEASRLCLAASVTTGLLLLGHLTRMKPTATHSSAVARPVVFQVVQQHQ